MADKAVQRGFLRFSGQDVSLIDLSARGGRYG